MLLAFQTEGNKKKMELPKSTEPQKPPDKGYEAP